jgi:DNA polymerase I-like protein with 3'-5' exonuclease and polymerase domains
MAFSPMVLNAGDFESYEVAIGVAAWNDEALSEELRTCYLCGHIASLEEFHSSNNCPSCRANDSRRKIHGLFAMDLFDKTYDEIIASKGSDFDMYKRGKNGVFGGLMYGGDEGTLERRVGIPEEQGRAAIQKFFSNYKGIQAAQQRIYDAHCSMRQEGGIGTRVSWNEPKEYVESMTGFKRYFSLENKICKELFDLAEDPPKTWLKHNAVVRRRDREQTQSGALRSATFAAAFQIQAACMRAALNHEIQSTGADLTKELQFDLWSLQPVGVNEWAIMTLNVHDEIVAPSKPELRETCKLTVDNFCERRRSLIPFLKMEWATNLPDWSEK